MYFVLLDAENILIVASEVLQMTVFASCAFLIFTTAGIQDIF